MPNYNISLNPQLARVVEKEIKNKKFATRSEFFRDLVRKYYVDGTYAIEELPRADSDYHLLNTRKRGARFLPLKDILH